MTDEELLRQFEDCTLPFEQWTHRAHVKIAFLYLRQLSFDQALVRIRTRIKKYNAAHQVPEGPHSGYNETMTQAFLRLIAAAIYREGAASSSDVDKFCDSHPQLMTKQILRSHYSLENWQPRCKTEFVEPDLAALPPVPVRTGRS